jgi:malonyl-CoA O-methyltransferase
MSWWKIKKEIKILSPLEGYNRWASSYPNESNPIKNLSDLFVEKNLPRLEGKNFLDSGCGTGKFCALAERQGATHVYGIDLSPTMIEMSRKLCNTAHLECADLSKIQIEEKMYDVIICSLVMGHIENLSPALPNLLNGLKNGGRFILTDFHPYLTLLREKRTFRDQHTNQHFEISHHLHLFQHYFHFFIKHGILVEIFEEPLYNNTPVIFGICGRKN